jgi:hypothetical protein
MQRYESPLMLAIHGRHHDAFHDLLLSAGADVRCCDYVSTNMWLPIFQGKQYRLQVPPEMRWRGQLVLEPTLETKKQPTKNYAVLYVDIFVCEHVP